MSAAERVAAGCTILRERGITLLLASASLSPAEASPAGLRELVAFDTTATRLDGLPDDLNPQVLDPLRLEAFVAGLPGQAPDVLRGLADKFLALGGEGLALSLASPVPPEAIEHGYVLEVPADGGLVVQPRLRSTVRPDYARAVAERAREALPAVVAEVAELERESVASSQLTNARCRRFAIALTWRIAASVLAELEWGARRDLRAAKVAVAAYVTPPWVGFPRR